MKVISSNWPIIRERGYASGKASYQVDAGKGPNGKRDRSTFRTKAEAESYAAQRRRERENEGKLATALPLEIRLEAAKCAEKLAQHNVSLTAVTDYYLQHVVIFRDAPTVLTATEILLQEKRDRRLRGETIRTLECFFRAFNELYADRQLNMLTLDELQILCLKPGLEPRTWFNRIRMANQLYRYALTKHWVDTNLVLQIPKPIWDKPEPGFLLVEQVRQLLKWAPEFDLLLYVVLGLFAGIRRAEMLRLDRSAIHREEREITISAEVAKCRSRRVITYDDTLAAWLELCPGDHGLIVDPKRFEGDFQELRKAAGIDKCPHNALRHSFATYHLAMHKNPHLTAFLMGHKSGLDMLDQHYKGLTSGTAAKEFWALRPPQIPGVIIDNA